jgi:hypothetical protein
LPWNAADTQVPLVVRILLSASPLAYYPLWGHPPSMPGARSADGPRRSGLRSLMTAPA